MSDSNPASHNWRGWIWMMMAGGQWAAQLPPHVQRNLRWFWADGLFAQVAESITLAYLSLYVLSLGATRGQIGWMSSLASLSAALLLLPGASLARRPEQRKRITLLGSTAARIALLLLAVIPFALTGPNLVNVAIALAVIRETCANLVIPAWTALTADIVPLTWRGRYFGMRNMAMGVVSVATTLLAGQAITGIGGETGYQWALGLAFVTGLFATFSFAQIAPPSGAVSATPEAVIKPAPHSGERERATLVSTRRGGTNVARSPAQAELAPAPLLQRLRQHPEFLAFCASAAVWNFSLSVAGPFFNLYVVERLSGDALSVGWLSVVSSLTALPGQRIFGVLTDRWGPRRAAAREKRYALLQPKLRLGRAGCNCSPAASSPFCRWRGCLSASHGMWCLSTCWADSCGRAISSPASTFYSSSRRRMSGRVSAPCIKWW
ncbi:MAG: MFS transporter [Anaerolineales bacterium]